MKYQQFVSPSRKCSSRLVSFGQGFLSKKTIWKQWSIPQNSQELAPADLYLFTQLQWAWKGQCFCDTTDYLKKVMKELKGFS